MTDQNALPAVFLDRDGVINIDNGYISKVDDFTFIEGVIDACKELKAQGYLLVVITNQSGIARGYFTEDDFDILTRWMDWSLADRDVELDGIYYCPHHATEGNGEFKVECDCRKPKPGMIFNAVQDLNIDLSSSILIGDKISDIQAGIAAGIPRNYLVETGKDITDEGRKIATDVFANLSDLVKSI